MESIKFIYKIRYATFVGFSSILLIWIAFDERLKLFEISLSISFSINNLIITRELIFSNNLFSLLTDSNILLELNKIFIQWNLSILRNLEILSLFSPSTKCNPMHGAVRIKAVLLVNLLINNIKHMHNFGWVRIPMGSQKLMQCSH